MAFAFTGAEVANFVPLLADARAFALAHHGEQRYGNLPYINHLDTVVRLIERMPMVDRVVGYLHDVVEDTQMTVDGVAENFGNVIAVNVAALTRRKDEAAERYFSRIAYTGLVACRVKAADRIANLLGSIVQSTTADAEKALKRIARYHEEEKALYYQFSQVMQDSVSGQALMAMLQALYQAAHNPQDFYKRSLAEKFHAL